MLQALIVEINGTRQKKPTHSAHNLTLMACLIHSVHNLTLMACLASPYKDYIIKSYLIKLLSHCQQATIFILISEMSSFTFQNAIPCFENSVDPD